MKSLRKNIEQRVAWGIVVIFIVNLLAMWLHWYSSMWWFDIPMHFVGGFWLAALFGWLFHSRFFRLWQGSKVWLFFTLSLLLIFTMIIAWEVFEFSLDSIVKLNIQNIPDALSDVCFGLSGGLLGTLYLYNKYNRYYK
ncbi:MAG: hypothetical protein ACI9AR_000609 [Flavobacteriaceae bacterium]|jgi:hypothetical protein